jgi:hypothetical protein
LPRKPNRNELLCVSLHGDYRYDQLKNTNEETQAQEATLRAALIEELRQTPLIVIGYSGRDASLMEAVEAAYCLNGSGSLYWCGFGDGEIPMRLAGLIGKARAAGRSAYYIPSSGFDDLLLRVALHSLDANKAEEAREALQLEEQDPTDTRAEYLLPELTTSGVIKSNAFPLTPPGEIFQFDLKKWPEEKAWEYFKKSTEGKSVVAAPFKGKGYAFGTIDDIRSAFVGNLGEKVERVPINDVDLRYEDSVINSLIRRALVLAFCS